MTFITSSKRGFAFWPFIFLPARLKNSPLEKGAYLQHEKTHCRRQGILALWWVIKYFCSKKFRWQEEQLAFKAEILYKLKLKAKVSPRDYVRWISTEYWGMCSKKEALVFVNKVIEEAK